MADTVGTTPMKKAPKPAKAPIADAIGNEEQVHEVAEDNSESPSKIAQAASKAKGAVMGEANALKGQATDKARDAANKGKAKVVESAGSVTTVIGEVANSIDAQFGKEYGDYARDAQGKVDEFIAKIDEMDIDDLVDGTREFVRKQPGVALGVAAAAGFAFIRLLKAGVDDV